MDERERRRGMDDAERTPRPRKSVSKAPQTKAELGKVWESLTNGQGHLAVDLLLKQRSLEDRLRSQFPKFLEAIHTIAKDGKVSKSDFVNFHTKSAGGSSEEDSKLPMSELQAFWSAVAGADAARLTANDLLHNRAMINKRFPLVAKVIFEKFESIDTTGDACVSWAELVGRLGSTDDWLEAELGQIIGLCGCTAAPLRPHDLTAARLERRAAAARSSSKESETSIRA
jgi:hypothetical protein